MGYDINQYIMLVNSNSVLLVWARSSKVKSNTHSDSLCLYGSWSKVAGNTQTKRWEVRSKASTNERL